jgi:HEAT repeat protein
VSLEFLLLVSSLVTAGMWGALAMYLLAIERRRLATRRLLARAVATIRRDEVQALPRREGHAKLEALLAQASRELVMRAAADAATPDDVFAPLVNYLTDRWGRDLLCQDASAHKSARDKWRRMAALRILFRANDGERFDWLAQAVREADEDIAGVALGLLGRSDDSRAMDILLAALRQQRHPPSRVAAHIERSPLPLVDRLRPLLHDSDPVLRLWSAALLARDPDARLEPEVVTLTHDPDPRVRKAAIQTLGKIGTAASADRAAALLYDPIAFVRAHAARALGELGIVERAEDVAALLGDSDWWTRLAAKETLEMMGTDVWPVLMRCLESEDRFVRNGAAEVIQNLGVLDSLIVMEAATDSPATAKIEMLRRITAAGGARFTDSLIERAGPIVGPRIRQLLATIGLDHVGAH